MVTGNVFTGEGNYGKAVVVKGKPSHAEILQHTLRETDKRECMISNVTPWRALMTPLQNKEAETFTALVDGEPVMMFGAVPEHDLVGSIWMLCSEVVDKHPKTFIKWSPAFLDYFQQKYFILQNVCPVEHYKTLTWLGYLGFMIMPTSFELNGHQVLRFVRCQDIDFMQFNDDIRPVIS